MHVTGVSNVLYMYRGYRILTTISIFVIESLSKCMIMTLHMHSAGTFDTLFSLIMYSCYALAAIFPSPTPGLRNDHKTVMKLIEEKLHQLHAEAKEKKLLTQQKFKGSAHQTEKGRESKPPLKGFARVNVVTDGSPAALAVGLQLCKLAL